LTLLQASAVCFIRCCCCMPKKADQISHQWYCNACKKQLHQLKPQRKACKSGSQRLIFVTKPRFGMQSRALPERKLQVWLLETTHHLEMQVQHMKTIRITHHNTRRCNYNRRRAGFSVMKEVSRSLALHECQTSCRIKANHTAQ